VGALFQEFKMKPALDKMARKRQLLYNDLILRHWNVNQLLLNERKVVEFIGGN